MLNVLIVDDDAEKRDAVRQTILEVSGVNPELVISVGDVASARSSLLKKSFDLLIVDMQIPRRNGERPISDGGVQLIEACRADDRSSLPFHIIGLTEHERSFKDAVPIFENYLWVLIKTAGAENSWQQRLKSKVEYLIASARRMQLTAGALYDVDVALICVTLTEMEAVTRLTSFQPYPVPTDSTIYRHGVLRRSDGKDVRTVLAQTGQMGMTSMAVLATKMIALFRPRFLVTCGVTAGVQGETNLGDVIVCDLSWDYGSGKIRNTDGERVLIPSPQPIPLDAKTKSAAQAMAVDGLVIDEVRRRWPGRKAENAARLHIGPLASGAAVVADAQAMDEVRLQNRKLLGVDMETYGVFFSAMNCPGPKPIAVSIKGVCDFGTKEKNDGMQPYAAFMSVGVLQYFLQHALPAELFDTP